MPRSAPPDNGVPASRLQLPEGQWPDLLSFLQQHFANVPADEWRTRLMHGRVLDDTGLALPVDAPYRVGASIRYYREVRDETPIPFEANVLYRDAHLLVADKPHFLPVIPAGRFVEHTLLTRLRRDTGMGDLVPLHRIDRATAGLVMFSVSPDTRAAYQRLFAQRAIHKGYEAIVPAAPRLPDHRSSRLVRGHPFFRMHEIDGPANSLTRFEYVSQQGAWARYRLYPVTGRKHQLRVHLAALGAPIRHDPLYPEVRPSEVADDPVRPLQLLAADLHFTDPLSGTPRHFRSEQRLDWPSS